MTAIVLITLSLLAFWVFGGVALRWSGVVAVVLGFAVALGMGSASGLLLILAGTIAWFAGHLHYRARHGGFKPGLAGSVLGRAL